METRWASWERTVRSSGLTAFQGVLALVAFTGVAFAGGEIRKELQFKVGHHPVISISNPYGPIIVRGGAPHQVSVIALLHSDKVEIDQSQSGSRISIISHLLPGADATTGAVDYEVVVPADANLALHSENGRLHAEKLHGDLTLEGSNAAVEVLECENGHVHVKTLDGTVTLTKVQNGHVEVVSMGGDVIMSGVNGPYVTVNSNTGKILYDGDFGDQGEYSFTSHTGNIEAVAPPSASIEVLARSTNGPVQSDFSLEPKHAPFAVKVGSAFHGTLNKAASSVYLFSFSGRIHLKKRQQ